MDNSQLRVCPFCGEKPTIEHAERFHRINCKNFYCDVQPRTHWCDNLEHVVKVWEGLGRKDKKT